MKTKIPVNEWKQFYQNTQQINIPYHYKRSVSFIMNIQYIIIIHCVIASLTGSSGNRYGQQLTLGIKNISYSSYLEYQLFEKLIFF